MAQNTPCPAYVARQGGGPAVAAYQWTAELVLAPEWVLQAATAGALRNVPPAVLEAGGWQPLAPGDWIVQSAAALLLVHDTVFRSLLRPENP